ncbi:hypothetical protein KAH37_03660 [bacterium]|nr:hypothetical protein [bacterium]
MTDSFSGRIIRHHQTPKRILYSVFTREEGVIKVLSRKRTFALLDGVELSLSRRGNTFFLQDYIITSPSPLIDFPQNLLPVSYLCSLAKEFLSNTESEHYFLDTLSRDAQQVMNKNTVGELERLWLKTTGFGRGDETTPSDIILECLPHLQRLRDSFA